MEWSEMDMRRRWTKLIDVQSQKSEMRFNAYARTEKQEQTKEERKHLEMPNKPVNASEIIVLCFLHCIIVRDGEKSKV
jgi:hypothetical protein